MIELILLAFNILVLIFIWDFFYKKSLLDIHRDQLFDLRCNLRENFSRKQALDSKAYRETRELLNAQIALTENLSILQYSLWSDFLRKNHKVKKLLEVQSSEKYIINDLELQTMIRKTREEASYVCSSYMIFNSIFLTALFIVLSIFIGVGFLLKHLFSNFKVVIDSLTKKELLHRITGRAILKMHLGQDVVEDASMLLIKS